MAHIHEKIDFTAAFSLFIKIKFSYACMISTRCGYLLAGTLSSMKIPNEADRSNEWRWFTKNELDALDLRPDVCFFAKLAIDVLGRA